MQEKLKEQLEKLLNQKDYKGKVSKLEYLTGGASNETWKFHLSSKSKNEELILRKSLGDPSPIAVLKSDEAKIQTTAFAQGASVPEIVAIADPLSPLGDAYVMKYIEGETIARKILRDERFQEARKKLAYECGVAIAKIHQVSLDNLKKIQTNSHQELLKQLYSSYKEFNQPLPVFEYAFRWLKHRDFGNQENRLVHGDFRLGNIIVNEQGLQAVIDWELAHIGNPIQDLGWICVNSWRFGQSEKIVGGFGELKDLLKGYVSICSNNITLEQIKTWQIFGTLRWGVICLIQTYAHLSGRINSVEKAAIGRRVSETEIDLVDLMFLGGE